MDVADRLVAKTGLDGLAGASCMRLLVYMRDGRTVFFVEGRKVLRQLMADDPAHEKTSVETARGIWNPHTGEYVWRRGIFIRHIAKGSISHVEEGRPTEAVAP